MNSSAVAPSSTSVPSRRDLANALRALSMDAVQAANSGHPGAPLGMADFVEVLWRDHLSHNPGNPHWFNRDRFVLSNGHGSMLIYSLLHLTGYALPIEELKRFRQLNSKTPGHPEVHHTPGIETTTGPLGQGIANAVGMALAEKILGAHFNREGFPVVDHHTYVCVGDGCLMEGISHEACSLAGTLGLGKLVALYDDNGISIDGKVEGWFTDDTPARFAAYGWHVVPNVDGHDAEAVAKALAAARAETARPSLVCMKTVIGFGSPNKAGTAGSHGAALGEKEVAATREKLGWNHPPFEIPAAIAQAWDAREAGAKREAAWQELFTKYLKAHPELGADLERRMAGELTEAFGNFALDAVKQMQAEGGANATRKSSQLVLEKLGPHCPELVGGSADLSESNNTHWSGSHTVSAAQADGNYLEYGVREFGMAAIMNGMALHGGVIPYGGTFLVFSDYCRNAVRMAALMSIRSIYVFTHDSIGLGEDGPTHQPIEHAAALRLIPNVHVWRPCDGVETAAAWAAAIERTAGPTALLLTRQGVPTQPRDAVQIAAIAHGGYVLVEPAGAPDAIVIATGSEVALAVAAANELNAQGARLRVVSMPCCERFSHQDAAYREAVLPSGIRRRIAIEAASGDYWYKFVGLDGEIIALHGFGASAPAGDLFKLFGLTAEQVKVRIQSYLSR